jgi:hypothetical protein
MGTVRRISGLGLGGAVATALFGSLASGGAVAATPVHHCPNKTLTVVFPPAEEGEPSTSGQVAVKSLTAQGLSCANASKFLEALAKRTAPGAPEHYKCVQGTTGASGYSAQTCSKPGKKIKYVERTVN